MCKLEVPVFSIDSALIAQSALADRLELCSGFHEGGTTPSHATILLAKELLNIPISVMIRPRGGDFLYSENEFSIMKNDIEFCKRTGVNGVVFGILKADGTVDKRRCKELLEIAKPLFITFHRAFDRTVDPFQALEDIIEIGFDRILTSGQEKDALLGAQLISKLIERSNGKIIIMPGCGINAENLHEIKMKTKAIEFHASAKKFISSKMEYHNEISMSNADNNENKNISTNADELKKLKLILNEN
jgi:copper homeostasis protein